MPPGDPYIFRTRSAGKNPIMEVSNRLARSFIDAREANPEEYLDGQWVKENILFAKFYLRPIYDVI